MNVLVVFALIIMAVLDFVMCASVLFDKFNRREPQNGAFIFMCFGNILSNVGYAIMLMQKGMCFTTQLSHAMAIVGILVFCNFSVLTYLYWIPKADRVRRILWPVWVVMMIFIFPRLVWEADVDYHLTNIGLVYSYDISYIRIVYYGYIALAVLVLFICSGIIFSFGKRAMTQRIAKGMMICNFLCLAQLITDIILQWKNLDFFPANTMLGFVGTVSIYSVLIATRNNRITLKNMSEFIYYNVEAPILIFDENFKLVIINRYATEFFEILEEDCIGQPVERFFPISEEDMKQKKQMSEIVCEGNSAICGLSINKLYDQYEEILGYMVFVNDQTEQVRAMQQVEESRLLAEEANRAKSAFLANMSHEIRTPINAILGMNEMILRETKDKNLVKYASDIKVAGNSLISLVNDILDFSKIESGKMELIPVEYELDALIADVINVLSFRAKEKGLKFIFDIDPTLPKRLVGDDVRVRQIFTNLLSNAIKYTSKGRVMLQVSGFEVENGDIEMRVAVADTGKGIKKEDIDKLFDAFTRIDEKKNRNIEGTGLGLNITNQLIRLMDGSINVKSTYGKGSTFSCTFRQKMTESERIGNFESYYAKYEGDTYRYHKVFEAPEASILVVDDNEMNLTVMDNLLKDYKMNIVCVMSGKEAVRSAAENYYDMILMDHMMPEMDGMEAFAAIRETEQGISKNAPIIAMTANAVAGARQMYLDYGFEDYLSKPIDPAKLEQVILKFVLPEKIRFINTKVEDWIKEDNSNGKELKCIQEFLEKKGINAISGLRNMNNNISHYQDSLKMFVKSYTEKKAHLLKYLENGQAKEYGIDAHALKGNAKMIGADLLANVAYRHEMAGKEVRMDDAALGWDDLEREWDMVVGILSEYLKQVDLGREENSVERKGLKQLEKGFLEEKLAEIKEAVEDYDHQEGKKVIELLMDYELPQDTFKTLKSIYKCLQMIDYDGALELAADL